MIYTEVYDIVVKEKLQSNRENLEKSFYEYMLSKDELVKKMTDDEFFQEYDIEFQNYVFSEWINTKKEKANIYILQDMEEKR